MKRLILFILVVLFTAPFAPEALAGKVRVVRRAPHARARVVVHRGHPIHRPLPVVVVRAPRVAPRVVARAFLAPVVWAPVVVVRPGPSSLVWEDSQTLDRSDDWTDFTLNVDGRGRRLVLEVASGRAEIEFAEVVFENGETQVVDFGGKTLKPGLYSLLDFKDGRKVDHVRWIARSKSPEARLVVLMVR